MPLIRAGAWFCIVLLGVLSRLPASLEKRTGLPGPIEHLFAYFCTAVVIMLAYPRSSRLKLIGYAALLEAGQLYVQVEPLRRSTGQPAHLGPCSEWSRSRASAGRHEHQRSPMNNSAVRLQDGDCGRARTCNPQLRRLMLHPGQRRGRMLPFKRLSWPLTTLRAGVMFSQRLARKALLSRCVLAGALQPDVTSALTLPRR